jgi:DNA repair exonuclease SbcCD ATPase subunit
MEDQSERIELIEESDERGLGSRLLRFLLRLFVVLVIGAGIGIGAYYGVPALYRDFIEPIQSNSNRIAALEESVARIQVDFREKNSELSSDLVQIEGEVAQQREDLSGIAAKEEAITSQIEDLTKSLDENQRWTSRIEDLEERYRALGSRFESLEETLLVEESPYERLETQIQLLRAMELVTRARFWMIQGNLGEASEDLTLAKGVLENLEMEDTGRESLLHIIDRLDQVLFEISLNPIIAADDLEIVWQLLLLATEP